MKRLTLYAFCSSLMLALTCSGLLAAPADPDSKAQAVVNRAIEAMGGEVYLAVNRIHSRGRYFHFGRHGKAFSRFEDWTVLDPVKWRFQLGDGKRAYTQIFNLEVEKGWTLEREVEIEEAPSEELDGFRRMAKQDIDVILRHRRDEEGMNLYYYGPDEIAGQGEYEAVEFLDGTNDSVIIFFNLRTGLPEKVETSTTNKMGVRIKIETEYSNWHEIQGVRVPLNLETFADGVTTTQRFIEEITFNENFPADLFQRPVIVKKK